MYFAGSTKCFLCGHTEELQPTVPSGWRGIKAEKKIYYFCLACVPEQNASSEIWQGFYFTAVKKIFDQDFKRPIKKIIFLRDMGSHAEIIDMGLN